MKVIRSRNFMYTQDLDHLPFNKDTLKTRLEKSGAQEWAFILHDKDVDENNKIIGGRLEPGASIGEHTHETNSEIIFFTSGKGKVIYDGKEERVEAGLCHYCPQGHTHTLINDSNADLTFYAVIPEHPTK